MKIIIISILSFLLSALGLCVLMGVNVWLVSQPAWLALAYTRPGFPSDPLGLDTTTRLQGGLVGLDYVTTRVDADEFQNYQTPSGEGFNSREVVHMEDVREVFTLVLYWVPRLGILFFLGLFGFWQLFPNKWTTYLSRGLLTVGILITLSISLGLLFWEQAFDLFHRLLFSEGSWLFYEDDLLIRLYPPTFWFDTALLLTILFALELILIWRILSSKPATS